MTIKPATLEIVKKLQLEALELGARKTELLQSFVADRSSINVKIGYLPYEAVYAAACSLYDKAETNGDLLWDKHPQSPSNFLVNKPRALPGIGSRVFLLDCFNYGRAYDTFLELPKVSLKDFVMTYGDQNPYNRMAKMPLTIVEVSSPNRWKLQNEKGIVRWVSEPRLKYID
jgi:hypothetical protein